MAKNGLILKYLKAINDDWERFELKEKSKEALAHKAGVTKTAAILKSVAASRDPESILQIEEMTLNQEKLKYANSAEMEGSVKTALEQLKDASEALKLVNQPETYKHLARAFSAKRKVGGLPMDAFREFAKGHQTRLTNLLKSSLSKQEKGLLRQRKANLKVANEIYMGLQRKALGMNKEQGLER